MTSGGGSREFGDDSNKGADRRFRSNPRQPHEEATPPGTICMYAGKGSPEGWSWCKGEELSRTEAAEMFTLIGTTFGEGDGSTTFNLPYLPDPLPGIHYIIKMAGRQPSETEQT
jgi:hypothetical protein